MGKLILVVGNTGVGKTALTDQLRRLGGFVTGLEQHIERPFQALFSDHLQKYALHNQVDYLLFRAEQELAIRESPQDGIQDGGLEMDYHVFTRHFHNQGYLDDKEFELCRRMYHLLRRLSPGPDVIIRLVAPLEVIVDRFSRRGRGLEIATLEDLQAMQALLDEWLDNLASTPVITVDASRDDPRYTWICDDLLGEVGKYLDRER